MTLFLLVCLVVPSLPVPLASAAVGAAGAAVAETGPLVEAFAPPVARSVP